ncbi:MAG: alpha-L-arabinofuranosidase C-terminal domain-containing protein [Aristaeellaceae bacterium]
MRITLRPDDRYKPLGDLFGLFFEDLNHAADGGLYAELICNRDFEFDEVDRKDYTHLTAWAAIGNAEVSISTENPPFPHNPHYAIIKGRPGMGICNLGYGEGIPAQAGRVYKLRLWARADKPMTLRVTLCGAQATITLGSEWACHEATLVPAQTDPGARLSIIKQKPGKFALAFVSLMPADTWQGQANMLRRDIAQALADMKPRFLRFPGGCLTHDGALDPDARNGIYNWKRTLGPVENRPSRRNNWGYHQTMGLGFYEYFLFCEDLGCEPLPVINGGIDPHHLRFAEGELLEQYIQDAVDLIEFAKGAPDTPWGSVRAQMGHPAPFRLNYLAVGNEEIHEQFHQHMTLFAQAIRAKDPTIRLIGSSGPFVHGKPYDMGWQYAREQGLELVDEHYYLAPEWFLSNSDHYADAPADGPKVFLGEYASWGNTMENALAEAAYMTGLQRAPSVALACYAPMLCHVNYVNWKPDMLWFDNSRLMKTPNYYVQRMFMHHQGDWAVPVEATDNELGPDLSRRMAGRMFILADDETGVRISDIRLTTPDGVTSLPGADISDGDELPITAMHGDNFRLELTLERFDGSNGVSIRFGYEDEENYYHWTVGGWQNSDSALEHMQRDRNTCLTQSNLYMQDGQAYRLMLEVRGREIITHVNGEELNRVTEQPLRLRPLYLAASVEDATGDVLLKAVNVQADAVTATIDLPCRSMTVETLCAPPETVNTLDEPDAVAPATRQAAVDGELTFTFPGYSVTILRLHP